MGPPLRLPSNVAACPYEFLGACFEPPSAISGNPIFGFAEFMAALALLFVLYTISDVRYRFRLQIAPLPLQGGSYITLALVGVGSLISDLWFAEGWPVPSLLSKQALWQASLAAAFLCVVLIWTYIAFIRPPTFSRWNAERFGQALYRIVVRGADSELAVIASELVRSADPLVRCSRTKGSARRQDEDQKKIGASAYAHDILLLMGSRKLCRHIVSSSPVTAIVLLESMAREKLYTLPAGPFATNVTTEALINKDSPLYHEDAGYSSGLIGYLRPFSKAMYGNFTLVENLDPSPLDIDLDLQWNWDPSQLEAYCRAVLVTYESRLAPGRGSYVHSYKLDRALERIEWASMRTYELDGVESLSYFTDQYRRLRTAVKFCKDAVHLLEKQEKPPKAILRRREWRHGVQDYYDDIASMMFEIIDNASAVTKPSGTCWTIQHNTVWSEFFRLNGDSKVSKAIHFKLRRLLYDEIMQLSDLPNFKSARILALCLNVMGVKPELRKKTGYGRETFALKKVVLKWVAKNYLRLREIQPDVADACIAGGISFDEEGRRLVKSYIKGLNREVPRDFLNLLPRFEGEDFVGDRSGA